jgi:transcriptional regulator with XRE-family HTH domain
MNTKEENMRTEVQPSPLWLRIEELSQQRYGMRGYLAMLTRAGCSSSTIQMLKLGVAPRRAETRRRIAEALGISVEELFGQG